MKMAAEEAKIRAFSNLSWQPLFSLELREERIMEQPVPHRLEHEFGFQCNSSRFDGTSSIMGRDKLKSDVLSKRVEGKPWFISISTCHIRKKNINFWRTSAKSEEARTIQF
jgi:hypothetical protein